MTSKDYKALAEASIEEINQERERQAKEKAAKFEDEGWTAEEATLIVHMQGEWRRSAYNYELPPDDDTAYRFEVMSSEVVENTESTVSAAFALSGLDTRNPNHWYDLLAVFTDLHLKRKPKTKKRTKPFLDELKADAEEIAEQNPHMTRSDVIEELKSTKHRMLEESTISGLLSKAKAKGFAKSYRRREP